MPSRRGALGNLVQRAARLQRTARIWLPPPSLLPKRNKKFNNPSNSAGGGYVVQVTSERSESTAHAAFRALQAKYPSQLSGRQAMIRRADLGAAGIYYRALVGPFASAEKAAKLCSGLKAAGGDCIIQKN